MAADAINYADSYQTALDQAFPYALYFGDLYAGSNKNYRWLGAKSIEIPTISTTGRVDADRDNITTATRNFSNYWTRYDLKNERKWETLINPKDIDETNFVAAIENITRVYNQENKWPEMDAYLVSKIYSDFINWGKSASYNFLDPDNIFAAIDSMSLAMTNARVPETGRILYCTPETARIIANAHNFTRNFSVQSGGDIVKTAITGIDLMKIVEVPKALMRTVYDFTVGFADGAGAEQIDIMLIHPSCLLTPVKYTFAQLDPPSAGSNGNYVYFEESYEDVFLLKNKADAVQFSLIITIDV